MSDAIETFEDEATGIKAKVEYDPFDNESPRDFDGNVWTLIGFSNPRVNFGDEEIDFDGQHWIECPVCKGADLEDESLCGECGGHGEVEATDPVAIIMAEHPDAHLIVPVQCYDHSLVSYYAGNPTTEHWDTGTAGVAVLTKQELDEEFHGDEDKARKCLDGELETFTDWANGTIYAYVVESKDGDVLDSCCGFYGLDFTETEAKESMSYYVEQAHKEEREARYWLEREVVTV